MSKRTKKKGSRKDRLTLIEKLVSGQVGPLPIDVDDRTTCEEPSAAQNKVSSSPHLMAMKDEIQAAYPGLTDEELFEMLVARL